MQALDKIQIKSNQAALWFLGQAGYIIRSSGKTVIIDPYLSDSVARKSPDFTRAYPPPMAPQELEADVILVTHDHLDHLDPDTLCAYEHKETTMFVAPRLAAKKLVSIGIPENNVQIIDSGEESVVDGLKIRGIYAIPNDPAVIDTAGYRVEFENGRNFYHTSDTGFSDVYLKSVPQSEILLVCINGRYGNLNIEQACRITVRVKPKIAIPNHYDVMKLNSEDPELFRKAMNKEHPDIGVEILKVMQPFIWGES
jgi:L-ascorbate 6-phosphate lactonase